MMDYSNGDFMSIFSGILGGPYNIDPTTWGAILGSFVLGGVLESLRSSAIQGLSLDSGSSEVRTCRSALPCFAKDVLLAE